MSFCSGGGHREAQSTCSHLRCHVYRVGRRVYATQFHPEVSSADFVARAQVYRNHGYFPASELRAVSDRLAAASVTEPQRILRRFVELADG